MKSNVEKMQMNVKEYYQHGRYDAATLAVREPFMKARVKLILEKLNLENLSGKVLDLGCGDGSLGKELKLVFPQIELYGIDISHTGTGLAQSAYQAVQVGDLNEVLPYDTHFFDYVITHEVLEHVLNTDQFISESYRILKPKGTLIVTTPNLLAWYNRILCLFGVLPIYYELSNKWRSVGMGRLRSLFSQESPVGHIRVFNKYGMDDILRLNSFEDINIRGARTEFALPAVLSAIYFMMDLLFSYWPTMSSNLIVSAKKASSSLAKDQGDFR